MVPGPSVLSGASVPGLLASSMLYRTFQVEYQPPCTVFPMRPIKMRISVIKCVS